MRRRLAVTAAIAALVLTAACGESGPTAPTAVEEQPLQALCSGVYQGSSTRSCEPDGGE